MSANPITVAVLRNRYRDVVIRIFDGVKQGDDWQDVLATANHIEELILLGGEAEKWQNGDVQRNLGNFSVASYKHAVIDLVEELKKTRIFRPFQRNQEVNEARTKSLPTLKGPVLKLFNSKVGNPSDLDTINEIEKELVGTFMADMIKSGESVKDLWDIDLKLEAVFTVVAEIKRTAVN